MPYKDPAAQREYARLWMADRRAQWFEGKACVRCGSTEDLQVDHINPDLKMSHKVWSWSAERREVELSKCQVLCLTCHKLKTRVDFEPRHGTNGRYVHRKCRCGECRAAHTEVNRQYRKGP